VRWWFPGCDGAPLAANLAMGRAERPLGDTPTRATHLVRTFSAAGKRIARWKPECRRTTPRELLQISCHEPGRRSRECYGERRSASLRRTTMSLVTTAFGSGRSTGKCSEPLVIV
jgi:hypothetical protein